MSIFHKRRALSCISFALICLESVLHADPQLTSWLTEASTKYARIYTTSNNRTAGISAVTWTNTINPSDSQTSPTYAGVHEINYSSNWVYIKNTGLAPYVMGPWNNPNLPKNQGKSNEVYRFPRTPTFSTNKTPTGTGSIGFLVDGVSIYNTSDGFSYSYAHNQDASPITTFTDPGKNGDGIWNRDAWPNEGGSFDYALNHPQPSGQYHAHANPIGVRYVLGDNINYDSSTKFYSENTSATNWKHSPIIGWVNDGLPLYGPYGYSNPTNVSSGVRRMISGYVLRNGSNGTTDLNTTGRKNLPLWAQVAQTNKPFKNGPDVSTTYELGHYAEDYDYLGDHGYTQGVDFDLNKYNARYCVTPEYPNGTWAYFVSIKADGTPWYPYNVGPWYMATPPASTGQPPTPGNSTTLTVMNADTPLTQHYKGGTNTVETWTTNPVSVSGNTVTLSWNAVEGGTYQVSASTDLSSTNNWTNLSNTVTTNGNIATRTENMDITTTPRKFYKVNRTGMAPYDSVGY